MPTPHHYVKFWSNIKHSHFTTRRKNGMRHHQLRLSVSETSNTKSERFKFHRLSYVASITRWLNQPIWKIWVKMGIVPKVRGENSKKYLKSPARLSCPIWIHFTDGASIQSLGVSCYSLVTCSMMYTGFKTIEVVHNFGHGTSEVVWKQPETCIRRKTSLNSNQATKK